MSVVLVIMRHLRYFINPIPRWLWALQTPGIIAGCILPLSLLYIFINKLTAEKRHYVSSYNFFLLCLLLLLSASGLLMLWAFPTDIVAVKIFMLGIFTFMPATAPDSLLFVSHFSIFLLFLAFLPSHVFAAPLVIIEARLRAKEQQEVLHEK